MKKITLDIFDMDCASCAAVIENELKKQKGVNSVNVNFATEKAYLEIEESKINVSQIIKLIEATGYKASEKKE